MFVVPYTVNLCNCVFMTFSTSYCLYDTVMDPWNVCMYVQTGWICLHTLYSMYCLNESIVHPVCDWMNMEHWWNAVGHKSEVLLEKSAHFFLHCQLDWKHCVSLLGHSYIAELHNIGRVSTFWMHFWCHRIFCFLHISVHQVV